MSTTMIKSSSPLVIKTDVENSRPFGMAPNIKDVSDYSYYRWYSTPESPSVGIIKTYGSNDFIPKNYVSQQQIS